MNSFTTNNLSYLIKFKNFILLINMFADPKRPQKIVYYKHRPIPDEQSDFFQLISMLFGIISFLFKVKIVII